MEMYFDISGFQCKITEKAVIYPNNDYQQKLSQTFIPYTRFFCNFLRS